MTHAAGMNSRKAVSAGWFTAVAALLLAATGLVIALNARGDSAPDATSAITVPSEKPAPSGLITYEVTGKGFFNAKASGEQLGAASADDLHLVHNATEQDRVLSPDGLRAARIDRNELGVFLAAGTPGSEAFLAQIAGPSDPALVNGGKGAARAVEGIPLVVAWSPDSKQLAYGSITGEPYALQVITLFGAGAGPRVHQVAGGYVGELAWSPDGRYLAISTYSLDRKSHTVLMLDIQRGGGVQRVIDGCHLTWSPDSKYLAIHRDPGPDAGAWIISPDGQERYVISREPGAFPYAWRA